MIMQEHKKTELLMMCERFKQLKGELIHGGYTGQFLDETVIDTLVDEFLSEYVANGQLLLKNDLRRTIINMFVLGQLTSDLKI